MAITDINISETLKTNAPSIKYRGNEGPKSPQEEQMIMEQQQMAAIDPMMQKKLKLIEELMSQGYDFGSASNLADKILSGQDEQDIGMAYGGIAGLDGRRRYGLGSKFKKFVRKIIPNEVADIAVKAAPFIAPFNPLAAGLAAGIGGFDKHGSISKGLKSGLMNYGLGQATRYLGGADFQGLQNPFTRDAFSMPTGQGGIKELFKGKSDFVPAGNKTEGVGGRVFTGDEAMIVGDPRKPLPDSVPKNLLKTIKDFALDNKAMLGILGVSAAAAAGMGAGDVENIGEMDRGAPLKIREIRREVIEAFKDPSGDKLKAIRIKYPFLGAKETKNIDLMAQGGRAGFAEGGGIMDLGGMEKDYRNTGGFVDIGAKEKADDVPARLSVNEFVMTADAVRGAGGGDIDKGAEIMERVMENLEKGGRISEESQGLKGAQEMFEVSERLSEVV
jgi:hypothetical protein